MTDGSRSVDVNSDESCMQSDQSSIFVTAAAGVARLRCQCQERNVG